jgi:hypothetical protein
LDFHLPYEGLRVAHPSKQKHATESPKMVLLSSASDWLQSREAYIFYKTNTRWRNRHFITFESQKSTAKFPRLLFFEILHADPVFTPDRSDSRVGSPDNGEASRFPFISRQLSPTRTMQTQDTKAICQFGNADCVRSSRASVGLVGATLVRHEEKQVKIVAACHPTEF